MDPIQATVLGVVQGLTEFLPISSSGHLILVRWLFGWSTRDSLAFDAALHLGTSAALLSYFWRDWMRLIRAGLAALRDRRFQNKPDRRLAWMVVGGSIPAGVAGLAGEQVVESALRRPSQVALLLALFGLLMLVIDRLGAKRRKLEQVSWSDTLVIGLAQVVALAPGTSRSGVTITAGLFRGLDREAAARFSFLLATPITVAAGLYKLAKTLREGFPPGEGLAFLLGALAAAIVGWLAIGFLLRHLQRNTLLPFVVYRVAAAAVVLLLVLLSLRPAE